MGDRRADKTGQEPSLELPSLKLPGLRRRRGRRAAPEAVSEPDRRPTPEPAPEPAPEPDRSTTSVETEGPRQPQDARSGPAPGRRRRRAAARRATVPTLLAVPLAGLVVGAAGVLLTWGGLRGCEALRGTSSCGGPGLLLLVAIAAVMVLTGSALLRLMRVPDPGGTSFLGVGIVGVVTFVGLLDVVFSQAMLVVLPLLGAVAFALARWVTTRFVDLTEEGPDHDVR